MSRATGVIVLVVIVVLVIALVTIAGLVVNEVSRSGGASDATSSVPRPAAAESERASPAGELASQLATPSFRPTSTTITVKILDYPHFTIGYDEQAKNPAWVVYQLVGPITHHGHEQRPATFATDFRTSAHVAHNDYTGSGYDRGHMCPAYAMFSRYGEEGLRSTFIMSNVIPQYHDLNAGEWEHLETSIAGRDGHGDGWAAAYGAVVVINGPVYGERPATHTLRSGMWIPTACFSVVLRQQAGHWDLLAVQMPNEQRVAGPVARYLTTVAAIDRATQLDLLAGFPEEEKAKLEQARATEVWP